MVPASNLPPGFIYLLMSVLLAVGIGLVCYGVGGAYDRWTLLNHGAEAQGQVVRHINVNTKNGPRKTPLVEFKTEAGEEIRFRAGSPVAQPRYAVGASVPLRYDPEMPKSRVTVADDDWLPWGISLFMVFVGVVMASIAGYALRGLKNAAR